MAIFALIHVIDSMFLFIPLRFLLQLEI